MSRPQLALNLFWRTFALLALLLVGAVLAWQQTFKALEAEPRALESAQQLAGLVNLSRAALANADAIGRVAVISSLASGEAVQVRVAEAHDRWQPYDDDSFSRRLAAERRLGAEFDVLWSQLGGKRAAAQAQARAAALQRSAADRALRAYRAGESGLSELLAVRRVLADALLAERLARSEALESDSRLRLDLHELWDFDD